MKIYKYENKSGLGFENCFFNLTFSTGTFFSGKSILQTISKKDMPRRWQEC